LRIVVSQARRKNKGAPNLGHPGFVWVRSGAKNNRRSFDFVPAGRDFAQDDDNRERSSDPTHSPKSAEWMGHMAAVGDGAHGAEDDKDVANSQ
jgi:hypothetical protein